LIADRLSVYAGSINEAEAALIAAASGTFVYQGESYCATSGALSQLRGYLSENGIDLTAAQSEKAVSYMYAHVAEGISRGYIKKISGDSENSSESISQDTTGAIEETERQVETETSKQIVQQQTELGGSNVSQQVETEDSNIIQQIESENSDTLQETTEDAPILSYENSLDGEESDTEAVLYNSVGIVKDTGYYFTNLWLVFFMFILLIGTSGIIIVRGYRDNRKDD
jgi:cobalamin biosynthesis Mg chelatase CobN